MAPPDTQTVLLDLLLALRRLLAEADHVRALQERLLGRDQSARPPERRQEVADAR